MQNSTYQGDKVVKANSSNAFHDNGGTLRYGGNASTSAGYKALLTNIPSLAEFAWNTDRSPTRILPPSTDAQVAADSDKRLHTYKALSTGNFATMTKGAYIIRRITTTVAGLANTTLLFGASNFGRQSIHARGFDRSGILSAWEWQTGSNKPTNAYGYPVHTLPVITQTYVNIDNTFTTDNAVTVTRAVPGALVYRNGSPTPYQDVYKAKTNG